MPASVSIFTHVQCGQNSASLREFQYTVSMRVIFIGGAWVAAAAYLAASGEDNSEASNSLRFIMAFPYSLAGLFN
jgi:hypothetical protein